MLVKVFAKLRVICGGVTVEVQPDGDRVIDVLNKMITLFPNLDVEIFTNDKKIKPFVQVYVNGQNIVHMNHLQTKIKETDQVAVFPSAAGS